MKESISLNGIWHFRLDAAQTGLDEHFEFQSFSDTIELPSTIALSQKGTPGNTRETGFLTDPYAMEGFTWYKKSVTLPLSALDVLDGVHILLTLERTRISHVWVDGEKAGTFDSLVAPHEYDLTPYIHSLCPEITIMVSNTGYKVPGGHLTSPDTQTNWNGILGDMRLTIQSGISFKTIDAVSDLANASAVLQVSADNHTDVEARAALTVSARSCRLKEAFLQADTSISDLLTQTAPASHTDMKQLLSWICQTGDPLPEKTYPLVLAPGSTQNTFTYDFTKDVLLWSESEPNLYLLTLTLTDEEGNLLDERTIWYGHRDFTADGDHFSINGRRTFLRGKHDGMIFPLTGFAPMSVEGWLSVMKTARDFGINHYRFHTCCPPEAAFIAADLLGIYMEPELPFWGTFNGPEDEGYNEEGQHFLDEEGFRILSLFSSHPSFCMMSMGNELWGNPSAINDLLGRYKAFRPQILFTQGSNNFQWVPNIQPNDDFFCGVRFTIDRQIRGSYAMCDKPLGHVQTAAPDTRFNYEEAIHPSYEQHQSELSEDGTIEIQYGTGVKRVKLTEAQAELVPKIPVVSHEIGQYCTFPDFREIDSYTGVLKAENFSVFKERLEEKRLDGLAEQYFKSSGALAVACYKEELETALRTPSLAGYQILDIQDFSGQGTALVGVLNALMENKGLVSAPEWRTFCSDAVVQAEFDSYLLTVGKEFAFTASLAFFRKEPLLGSSVTATLINRTTQETVADFCQPISDITEPGRHILGDFSCVIPENSSASGADEYELTIAITGTDITNHYTLWCYADGSDILDAMSAAAREAAVANTVSDALSLCRDHSHTILFLSDEENKASIEGTYCTDFWCYHMFRIISESMGKEIPVGTLGLLIDNEHPALKKFPSCTYSTPQWYSIVTASRSTILDDTDIKPIVQTIDNFERNHRLGMIYEVYLSDLNSTLLICTSNLPQLMQNGCAEAAQLYKSLCSYAAGASDASGYALSSKELCDILSASGNH